MEPIPFAGAAIDRAAERRVDAAWLDEARSDPAARAVLVGEGGVSAEPVPLGDLEPVALLGVDGDEAPVWAATAPEGATLVNLRTFGATGDPAAAGLAAYATALAHFHAATQFCGRCGAPTTSHQGGYMRRCENGHEHYPRTDPVVITLVIDGDERVVLGRQAAWPAHRYSALAGFVDQGESLDQAVAREVAEEAGIEVSDIRYVASQPWPFPCSLMIGFSAQYAGGEVHTHDEELEDVRWFSREEVVAAADEDRDFYEPPAAGRAGELVLPPRIAIARHLIQRWLSRP